MLGGVRIDHAHGLEGHSDADVLCHAVADALLGAVADGDIGVHFPNTDSRWKDADSIVLLRQVTARLRNKGWHVVNVDASVVAEQPRIRPYVDEMRGRMAEAMAVTPEQVSVKATTAERLGALGRGEGIAVMAVALVEDGKQEDE